MISAIRKEERPNEEVVAATAPTLVVAEAFIQSEMPLATPEAVEYPTSADPQVVEASTPQETAIQAEPPTAEQLVDGFLGLFVQLQSSWSAAADAKWEEYMRHAENNLAELQNLQSRLNEVVQQATAQVTLLRSAAAMFANRVDSAEAQQVVKAVQACTASKQ